jgi:hypothetical protein
VNWSGSSTAYSLSGFRYFWTLITSPSRWSITADQRIAWRGTVQTSAVGYGRGRQTCRLMTVRSGRPPLMTESLVSQPLVAVDLNRAVERIGLSSDQPVLGRVDVGVWPPAQFTEHVGVDRAAPGAVLTVDHSASPGRRWPASIDHDHTQSASVAVLVEKSVASLDLLFVVFVDRWFVAVRLLYWILV